MILSPDQEMVRDAVRAFAKEELWPHAAQWDKERLFPAEAHKGLAALGAYGICVPEEFGGANFDYVTLGWCSKRSPPATVEPVRPSASPTVR